MGSKKPLLSICIPTYNRANILDRSLEIFLDQYEYIDNKNSIEIIISDNNSADNTLEVIEKYISYKLPIQYKKNTTNIGPDMNFIQCFHLAKGKYMWLLGDDDFLKEGALYKILNILSKETYGIVNLQMISSKKTFSTEYDNPQKFTVDVGLWFTFISGNIVNTNYVSKINFSNYIGSYMIQVPLYMTAALSENRNILIHERLLDDGIVSESNGGYNLFEVFVTNYLGICKSFISQDLLSRRSYEKIKYKLYQNFLTGYIYKLLIKREKTNFKTENAWKIIFYNYGMYPYFYLSFALVIMKKLFYRIRR